MRDCTRASDGSGDINSTADVNVTIRVNNLAPTIASSPPSEEYDEGGEDPVATYEASDPGGGDIFWSISGTDQLDFTITEGELNFADTPDFENPTDDDPDNDYEITVMASDGDLAASLSDSINVTVTVTDVNESPDIDLPDLPGYAENGTDPVAMFMAVDPEGDAIAWTLPDTNHATDRRAFTITGGVLKFEDAPDFESPQDSRPYNSYKVTIRASDGRLATSVNVTINVTDVNEKPAVEPPPIADQTITASVFREISLQGRFTDPDGDTLTYTAATSRPRIATASVTASDNTLTLGAVSAGSARITVTAADRPVSNSDRLTAEQTFTVTVEPNTPAKVTGLTGKSGSVRGTIDLDWDPADRADDYEVEQWRRRLLLPDHWVLLTASEVTIDLANTSAVVRGLEGGESYRHRVRGIRGTGANKVEGAWSDEVDTTLTLPAKVTGLTGAPSMNSRAVDLSWNAANDAPEYQVRQREHHNIPRPDNWIVLPVGRFGVTISGTTTSRPTASVTGLDPEKTYVYQVRGRNVHGEGEWSDATAAIAVRPDMPQGLTSQYTIGHRGVSLHWSEAAGAAEYEVEVARTGSSFTTDVSGEWIALTGLIPRTTYSFKVRAWHTNGGTRLHSPWSAMVVDTAPEPTHWWGHQADHKVKYAKGNIANNLIEDRIAPAASAWNSETASLGKGLEICTGAGCINPDGFTVTIKTVNNKNNAVGKASVDPNEGCGRSRACVKPVGNGGTNASAAPGLHMENMFMVFEDPPWFAEAVKRGMSTVWVRTEYAWTDDEDLNGEKVTGSGSPGVFYVYVDRVMLHEFGHTLGLPDFYNDKTGLMRYSDAVMDTGLEIHEEDINQLRAIYVLHNPH